MIKYCILLLASGCAIGLSPHDRCESAGYPTDTESFAHCLALEGGSLENVMAPTASNQNAEAVESEFVTKEIEPESFCRENGFTTGTAFFTQCLAIAEGREHYIPEEIMEAEESNLILSADTATRDENK